MCDLVCSVAGERFVAGAGGKDGWVVLGRQECLTL